MKPEDLENLNIREIKDLFCDFYNSTEQMFLNAKQRGSTFYSFPFLKGSHLSNCKKVTKILKNE